MCYGTILSSKIVRARKAHRCPFCRHPIMPGRPHRSDAWARDGGLTRQHSHERCMALIEQSSAADDEGCVHDERALFREAAKHYGWRGLLERLRGARWGGKA